MHLEPSSYQEHPNLIPCSPVITSYEQRRTTPWVFGLPLLCDQKEPGNRGCWFNQADYTVPSGSIMTLSRTSTKQECPVLHRRSVLITLTHCRQRKTSSIIFYLYFELRMRSGRRQSALLYNNTTIMSNYWSFGK